MKKKWSYFLLLFLACSSISLAQFETLDRVMRSLAYTDDKNIRNAANNYVVDHPQVAKEILFLQNAKSFQNAAKHNAFVCLEISSYKGLISPEEFFDVGCQLVANIDSFHTSEEKTSSLVWYNTGLANYDWAHQEGGLQDLMKLFNNLPKILMAMEKNGMISNSGIRNSLTVKIDGAKDAIIKQQAKGITQAINKIEAAIKEGNAQKGKQLKEDACVIFVGYCQNLVWQINHTIF